MSSFYGYSHYYRARYEAEKHARDKAQRALDRASLHEPLSKPNPRNHESDTNKGLLMMIAVAVLPVAAIAALVLLAGQ